MEHDMSDAAQSTQQQGGFDLGGAATVADREDAGQWVELRDANGDVLTYGAEQSVRVRVAGTYSKRFRRAKKTQTDRQLRQRKVTLNADQLEENSIELVSACVMEWEGFFNAGAPLSCSPDNVALVLKRAPWIRDQIEQAMDDHASFSRADSPS
jgi:hypothetical protein